MTQLPYTDENVDLIQDFLDETNKRFSNGSPLIFTAKASSELETLALEYDIDEDDIQAAIMDLTVENYYRGIDPSGKADFNVCAFCTQIGDDAVEIYLKYGIQVNGIQILLFSNHVPDYPMNQPFKN